eukprot:Phypoly_transcript_26199.p1 GENE.Phypoly_transcript_26199~~Phypoly_transcript_26199.p1  ORF type:complete len:126 (-),score=6.71 Phypoly_transcript_26199:54-431(-)
MVCSLASSLGEHAGLSSSALKPFFTLPCKSSSFVMLDLRLLSPIFFSRPPPPLFSVSATCSRFSNSVGHLNNFVGRALMRLQKSKIVFEKTLNVVNRLTAHISFCKDFYKGFTKVAQIFDIILQY